MEKKLSIYFEKNKKII